MLHIIKVRVTLEIELSDGVLRSYLPASPQAVGGELAAQVDHYSRAQKLGYYPALDYFQHETGVVGADVLDAAQNIAWFAGNAVREEIQMRLRPVFANVALESTQCLAFTFPPVRLHQDNALAHLAAHYTPNTFRLCLLLSSLSKQEALDGDWENLTRRKLLTHLMRHFNGIEITSVQLVRS
jgi:hypothetical protein